MKKILVSIVALIISNLAFAGESQMVFSGRENILEDTKDLVKVCVVMVISQESDNQLVRSFESHCETLQLVSRFEAKILIGTEWFTASIVPSEDSDDGDLNDMELRNSAGQLVATRLNVASFDYIVLAMTGGDQDLETRLSPR